MAVPGRLIFGAHSGAMSEPIEAAWIRGVVALGFRAPERPRPAIPMGHQDPLGRPLVVALATG
jgi:hypothetical protein